MNRPSAIKRSETRTALALALFAWATLMTAGGALAQGLAGSAEAALTHWVATIDASPDWSATYRSVAYDPTSDSVVLSGLAVRSERAGFTVDVDTVAVSGLTETADGTLRARQFVANGGVIAAGIFSIGLSDLALDDFVLPPDAGFTWDPARPFTSMIHAYGPLARISASAGRLGKLSLTETVEGVGSRVVYSGIALKNWADGRIASLTAGPLSLDTPSDLPLITMRVARGDATGIDIGAILHVYDPDSYVGGVGDGTWRSAVASARYSDVTIEAPGAKVSLGSISVDDLKARQPGGSFAAMFDAAMLDPFGAGDPAAADRSLDLASAFSVGRFAMGPIDVQAIGFDRLHVDDISVDDLSIAGLGRFAIDGLEGVVSGQASVKVGRLAFGGIKLPSTDTIATAMRVARVGGDVDFSSLLPTLGFVETGGVDVDVAGIPRTRLGKLRVDLADYVGSVPTAVTVDIADADFATTMIAQDSVRNLLASFGYERLHVDSSVKVDWDEASDATVVDDFKLSMSDIGTLSGDARFTGPTRSEIEKLDSLAGLDSLFSSVSLQSGTFTFQDQSLVGRAIAGQAAKLKVDPDKFREQFARGLPFMLSFLGNRDFQKKITPILQAFIRTPGSITVMTAPTAPIAVSAIMTAIRASPFSLPNLLALTVSNATAGPAAGGAAAAPAPQ